MNAGDFIEWVTVSKQAYGKHGKEIKGYVADWHVGAILLHQEYIGVPIDILVSTPKIRGNKLYRAESVNHAKAYIAAEFAKWFLSVNKLAWEAVKGSENENRPLS